MPKKLSDFKTIEKKCLYCGEKLKLNNTRDIIRKNFCSRICNCTFSTKKLWENENFINKMKEISKKPNPKKGRSMEKHHLWIEDRTKLKSKRLNCEEKKFFKEILKERNYTCEISNDIGGKLSVHHLDSVSLFPDKIYDKNNVIVIKYEIHKEFHKEYGCRNITKEHWINYINSTIFKKWIK